MGEEWRKHNISGKTWFKSAKNVKKKWWKQVKSCNKVAKNGLNSKKGVKVATNVAKG